MLPSNSSRVAKPRKSKNRKTKTSIEFNDEDRVSFLTGFRKRKNERRKMAQVQMEQEFKAQLARAREKAKNSMKTSSSSYILPEVEALLPECVIKTSTHTVSITPLDSIMSGESGTNHEEEDGKGGEGVQILKRSEKKALNKLTLKAVSKSRAFKAKKQSISKQSNNKSEKKHNKASKRNKHFHPNKSTS